MEDDKIAPLFQQIHDLSCRVETSSVIIQNESKKHSYYESQINDCFKKVRELDKAVRYDSIKDKVILMKNLIDVGLANTDSEFSHSMEELMHDVLNIVR